MEDGIELVVLSVRHISVYDQIPLFDNHRDPFDRLILATALVERIPIISADEKFTRYRDVVELIW
nr:PIN domain-containing protein [uncultured Spirosoma sp.]